MRKILLPVVFGLLAAVSYAQPAAAASGNALAWGYNSDGQLGDGGTNTGSTTPVDVSNLSGIQAIDGGMGYSLALTSEGRVFAWGSNSYGQLGNGASGFGADSNTPVQVQDRHGVPLSGVEGHRRRSLAPQPGPQERHGLGLG